MSLSDAQESLRQIEADRDLAKEEAAAHRHELVALAREKGFDVTEEDIAAAASAAREAPFGEVDDGALEAVAGGTNATSSRIW